MPQIREPKRFLKGLSLVLRVSSWRLLLSWRVLPLGRHELLVRLMRRWRAHRPGKASRRPVAWRRRQVPLLHHHLLMHSGLLLLPLRHCLLGSLLVRTLPHLLPLAFARIDMPHESRTSRSVLTLVGADVDQGLPGHSSHVLLVPGRHLRAVLALRAGPVHHVTSLTAAIIEHAE